MRAREAIRLALQTSGLSQRQLAVRMDVTEGWVSQLLADDANPTWDTLTSIANACGLRIHVRFCHCSGGFICTPCKERAEEIVNG